MSGIIDRHIAPPAGPLRYIPLPVYETAHLSNGMPVYLLPYGQVPVVEVQAVFRAGRGYQDQTGLAHLTGRMLTEGTTHYDSLQLAQHLDAYGAWIHHEVDEEGLAIKLATTTANLGHTLPLFQEVVTAPLFPEAEFSQLKQRQLQKIQVKEEKTSTLARKHFGYQLFGPDHPYGAYLGQAELEALSLESLRSYHAQRMQPGHGWLAVVGQFDREALLAALETAFGHLNWEPAPAGVSRAATAQAAGGRGRHYVEKAGMQATLRLGHRGMPYAHPDYFGMVVVNTIFGGYFGSRLMKNIREEKGYTYGIYSAWVGERYDGYLLIQGDVGNAYVEAAIAEVRAEMQRLIEDGVSAEELDLVRNYLLGRSVSRRETPFQMGDLLRFSLLHDISFPELDQQYSVIREITPAQVQELAARYLRPADLLEVVVGQPE